MYGIILDNVAILPSRAGRGARLRLRGIRGAPSRHRTSHPKPGGFPRAMYLRYMREEIDRRTERGFPRVYMRKRL